MAARAVKTDGYEPRLKRTYVDEIRPRLARDRSLNVMAVPRLVKIVVNMGVGEAVRETKTLDEAVAHLPIITGPKPLGTKARRSIARLQLPEGVPIGAKGTLRGGPVW